MSLEVIPGILAEEDFLQFTDETFDALRGVLNVVTAKMILSYLSNPQGNREIQNLITREIGDTIKKYTLHEFIEREGLLQVIDALPASFTHESRVNRDVALGVYQWFVDNESSILSMIPKRKREDYLRFYAAICKIPLSLPGAYSVLEADRYLFYQPRETDFMLPTAKVIRKRNQWIMCYDYLRYMAYCEDNGVSLLESREF